MTKGCRGTGSDRVNHQRGFDMFTLHLKNGYPFAQAPCIVKLSGDKIALNDVMLPASIDHDARYNPNNVRLWVIGHEFGALCAVWAGHEQEAFDAAVDLGLLDCLMSEEQDHDDDDSLTPLGNASELFDLQHAWLAEVDFDPARDIAMIVKIVRSAENQFDFIEE